jgi:hypothetical protein
MKFKVDWFFTEEADFTLSIQQPLFQLTTLTRFQLRETQ